MFVQQDRIDAFHKELSECVDEWELYHRSYMWKYCPPLKDEHPDKKFVKQKENKTSVDFWLQAIPERMSDEKIRDSIFDPFISSEHYTGNSCWFKLAFDIAKLLNKPELTWFSICFPKANSYDPISFKPLLHVMPSLIYVVDRLPKKSMLSEQMMVRAYFPQAQSPNPCYVFEKKKKCLYRFIPHPDAEQYKQHVMLKQLIAIDRKQASKFSKALMDAMHPYRKTLYTNPSAPLIVQKKENLTKPSPSALAQLNFSRNRARARSTELKLSIRPSTDSYDETEFFDEGYAKEAVLPNFSDNRYVYEEQQKIVIPSFTKLMNENARRTDAFHKEKYQKQRSYSHDQSISPYFQNDYEESKKNYSQDIINEYHAPLYFISGKHLENLITSFGGYPWFDLRGFILNNNATLIYPLSSLFYQRSTQLTHTYLNESVGAYHLKYPALNDTNRLRILPGDIETSVSDKHFFKDKQGKKVYKLKPHHYAMYNKVSDIKRSPLSLLELHRMSWKWGPYFYYEGKNIYSHSKSYLRDVLMPSWRSQGRAPKLILPRLLEIFKCLFDEQDSIQFRKRLNEWSLGAYFYPCDTYELQDRLFLYAQNVSEVMNPMRKTKRSTFLDLFGRCFHLSAFFAFIDVVAMARWVSNYMPHLIINHPIFDKIYDNLKIARHFNYQAFIDGLTSLLPTAEDLSFSIQKLISTTQRHQTIDKKKIDEVIRIYTLYDEYVQVNPEYDHLKPQSQVRAAWRYFAEILTGAGWVPDPIKLLCPDIKTLYEPFTGLHFAIFDFQQLIFTADRKGLIALDSSKHLARYLGYFYHVIDRLKACQIWRQSEPPKRDRDYYLARGLMLYDNFAKSFTPREIESVQDADPRYQQYLSLAYQEYLGERLRLSTCLMIRYLIDTTVVYWVIDELEPRFVQEIYKFKPIRSLSEIPSEPRESILKKYFNDFMMFFVTPSSSKMRVQAVIYTMIVKDGVRCIMKKYGFLDIIVPFKALHSSLEQSITYSTLPNYFSKIIAYLEKRSYVQLTGTAYIQQQGLSAYKEFYDMYKKLNPEEQRALNNREIVIGDKKKLVKDVLKNGHFCMVETGVWLMALLLSIDRTYTFDRKMGDGFPNPRNAEEKLFYLFKNIRQNSYNFGYLNASFEAEKLFISLMITKFGRNVTSDEKQSKIFLLENCAFYDCVNAVPRDLAYHLFYPITNILAETEDRQKLGEFYVEILKNYLYTQFYKSMTEYTIETHYTCVRNRNAWIASLINGDMVFSVRTHSYIWLQDVYLSINLKHLGLSEKKSNLFDSFKDILKIRVSHYNYLAVNMKYLYFLRQLLPCEFLEFWGEVDPIYRKDIFLDYLSSQCQRVDDYSLVHSTQHVFKNELGLLLDMRAYTPRLYKSHMPPRALNLSFEELLERLASLIPPTAGIRRQPSTSPGCFDLF